MPSLSVFAGVGLELDFLEEEVLKALHDCCDNKSLGPDGMVVAFVWDNWDALRGDVLRVFSVFFHIGKFMASLNATFVG